MQFEARTRLTTKMYAYYIAGANERSNEEMRQIREFYFNFFLIIAVICGKSVFLSQLEK